MQINAGWSSRYCRLGRPELFNATLDRLRDAPVTLISTPILFTPDYRELVDQIGFLKIIRDRQAFRAETPVGETIPSCGLPGIS